jgi:hypothetical protein
MVFNATFNYCYPENRGPHGGRDRKIVESTANYSIGGYHHECCEFESSSLRGILDKACKR